MAGDEHADIDKKASSRNDKKGYVKNSDFKN